MCTSPTRSASGSLVGHVVRSSKRKPNRRCKRWGSLRRGVGFLVEETGTGKGACKGSPRCPMMAAVLQMLQMWVVWASLRGFIAATRTPDATRTMCSLRMPPKLPTLQRVFPIYGYYIFHLSVQFHSAIWQNNPSFSHPLSQRRHIRLSSHHLRIMMHI